MNIGKRLQELRKAKGFSQGDIEKRTGLLRCYTSRVENGHTIPSLDTLEKYAKALDLETYQLFFVGEGKPKAPQVAARSPAASLGPEERALLKAFSRIAKPNRRLVLDMARKMAAAGK